MRRLILATLVATSSAASVACAFRTKRGCTGRVPCVLEGFTSRSSRRPLPILSSRIPLILMLLAVCAGGRPAMAQNRTTTVEGTVFDDGDGDGRRDSGEAGLADMRVAVLDGATGKTLYDAAGAILMVRTDAQGLYRYQAPGNLDLRFRLWSRDGWLEATPRERRVTVASGDTQSRVDFGYQATTATTIQGSVFNDKDGDGRRDADDSGRANVLVAVLDGPSGNVLRTSAGAVVEVRTDDNGRFSYHGRGSLDLRLRPRDLDARTRQNPYGWLQTTPEERRVQAQNGSVTRGADFGYQAPRPTSVEGVVFDDKNRNGRQDRPDKGMPGIHIVLLDIATGRPLMTPDGLMVEVTTDASGHYRYQSTGSLDLRLRPRDLDARSQQNPEGWLDTRPAERRVQVPNGSVQSGADFAF